MVAWAIVGSKLVSMRFTVSAISGVTRPWCWNASRLRVNAVWHTSAPTAHMPAASAPIAASGVAVRKNLTASMIAAAQPRTAASFFAIHPVSEYRQPDAYGPPNTPWVPAVSRASARSTILFLRSSSLMIGSNRLSASMSPRSNADCAVAAVPTPIAAASVGFSPDLTSSCIANRCVAEPGADTPILRPFKSATDLISPASSFLMPRAKPLF